MSEIKVFVYDTCGKKEEVGAALERAGISLVDGEGEEALFAADYLLLSTADARELDDREVSQAWNFYLDELRWKRKESGEVIIIDCSDVSFSPSRLAYGLKKCKRFRLKQIDEATRYMTGGKQSSPSAGGFASASSYKPADYSESARYDKPEPKEEKNRESGACKESHVFGEKTQSEIEAEERKRAEAQANLDKIRKTVAERDKPIVKSEKMTEILEEARNRLEQRRKEQDADPRLNPEFDGKELERHEQTLKRAQVRDERSDDYNPFEGYPDYPKEDKRRSSSQGKNIGITIVISAVVLIMFMIITSTIGMCRFDSAPFSVEWFVPVKESIIAAILFVRESIFRLIA